MPTKMQNLLLGHVWKFKFLSINKVMFTLSVRITKRSIKITNQVLNLRVNELFEVN